MALAGAQPHQRAAPGGAAHALAEWATALEPTAEDFALANRALRDTVAVAIAASDDPLRPLFDRHLGEAGRLAALAHVLDYDDLHMPSTTHISAVCVPIAIRTSAGAHKSDGAHAYLAGAGAMARLGTALGWRHYEAGWHATCTAGAPAAAVTAAVGLGLDTSQIATAIALAIPGAGGVQRAFGTAAKALQVGFAADAGVRAANLAAAGATADPAALDDYMCLVHGDSPAIDNLEPSTPAVPGGLAVKLFPCCYALQRPISAVQELLPLSAHRIERIRVTTPASSVAPLIHSTAKTGLEGKFSLEYAIAATILDHRPDIASFTDAAVQRPEAQQLMAKVQLTTTEQGTGLLADAVTVEITFDDGQTCATELDRPPGAPDRPPTDEQLSAKLGEGLAALTWASAPSYLDRRL